LKRAGINYLWLAWFKIPNSKYQISIEERIFNFTFGIWNLIFGILIFMRREFLLNILFLVFINLLIKPFFIFGIDRTIQNRVGLEEYGIYAALFNFTFLLNIINDFGLPNFTSQRISQKPELFPTYLPNILLLKLFLSFLFVLVVCSLSLLIGYEFEYYHLIGFLLLNQILVSFLAYFRSNIAGLGHYRVDSFMSIVERTILIIICAVLLWFNPWEMDFQIEWFIYAQTASLFLATTIAGLFILKYLSKIHWQVDTSLLKDLLRQSAPYALVIFLMTIYTRIDFVMLERLAPEGRTEAGTYATAYRLLDAANMLGLLFAGLLLPMFSRLLKEKEGVRQLVQISARLLFWGTIAVSIIVAFFRLEIMELLYIHTDQYAADILGILIFTFNLVGGGYIYGTLLTANNSLLRMNQLFVVTVVLNVVLNYLVIPEYGAKGVAITTLLTQSVAFLGQLLMAKQMIPLRWDWTLSRDLGVYTILIFTSTFTVYYYLSFAWEVRFILLFLVAIGWGMITRLLNIQWFLNLVVKSKLE